METVHEEKDTTPWLGDIKYQSKITNLKRLVTQKKYRLIEQDRSSSRYANQIKQFAVNMYVKLYQTNAAIYTKRRIQNFSIVPQRSTSVVINRKSEATVNNK